MGLALAALGGLHLSIVGTRCARLSARRESGATRTRGDLTATACRNAKTSSQSSAMVANVLAVAVLAETCFALPGFVASAASTVTTLSSPLASSASLEESASETHSVMERAKIFRSSPSSDFSWRIAASVKNGGRRTALQEVQSRCFLDRAKKDLRDRETDLFAVCGKIDLNVEKNY